MAKKNYYNVRRITLMFGNAPDINIVASDLAEGAYTEETDDTSELVKLATETAVRVFPFAITKIKFEIHKFSPVYEKLVDLIHENFIDGSFTLIDNAKKQRTYEKATITGYEFGGGNDVKILVRLQGELVTNLRHD